MTQEQQTMTKHLLRRGISALGISLAVAITAIAPASYAQPQPLPGSQYQTPQYPPPPPPVPGPQYQGPQYQAPQYAPPPPNAQYPYQGQYRNGPGFQRGPGQRQGAENRLDRRLAFLHQRIAITPAQEAAWTQFASEVRATETQPSNMLDREREAAGNVVQRLELRKQMLARRSADLDRVLTALRPLYASFTDDQKRTADQLLFRPQRPNFTAGRGFRNGPRPGVGDRTPS
jgi:hypothetical protein